MQTIVDILSEAGLELVERNVGGGGSATVHQCRVIRESPMLGGLGTLVAAKEYKPDILRVPNQRERIRQETDIGQKLRHPNLVRTYGLLGNVDEDGKSSAESPLVLLLEWVQGQTLDKWYGAATKPVQWDALRTIGLDLAAALQELHDHQIVHRDIKPENVMVREHGSAVLMDIGVAELTSNDESTLHTSLKDFVGSVRYASPQFIMGADEFATADDVYSLAATLFLPFTGNPIYAEVERKPVLPIAVVNNPPQIKGVADGVPASIKVLLQGALHRDRKRRPSLTELRECLEQTDGASYLTSELARQANDVRTYTVLEVIDEGMFFADLAGDSPELNEVYTVVRQAKKALQVPSYSRDVVPEMWIADAVLKHIHQNVGHFAIRRKRWQEGQGAMSSIFAQQGHWIDAEETPRKPNRGDLVLRKTR